MGQRQEFYDAMIATGHTVRVPESDDFGRCVLHTYLGGFGADWDLQDALVFVRDAMLVGWSRLWLGHELWATDGDRNVYFGVEAPEGALSPDTKAPVIE